MERPALLHANQAPVLFYINFCAGCIGKLYHFSAPVAGLPAQRVRRGHWESALGIDQTEIMGRGGLYWRIVCVFATPLKRSKIPPLRRTRKGPIMPQSTVYRLLTEELAAGGLANVGMISILDLLFWSSETEGSEGRAIS